MRAISSRNFHVQRNTIPILFNMMVLFLFIAVAFGIYQYINYRDISSKVLGLENEVQNLNQNLQNNSNPAVISTSSNKQPTKSTVSTGDLSVSSLVSKVSSSVVSIIVSRDMPKYEKTYLNPFGDDPSLYGLGFEVPVYRDTGSTTRQEVSAGTGFILSSNGYVLTNRHVVADKQAYYTILLSSGARRSAEVVYRDIEQDLAVLKMPGNNYSAVAVGNSQNLKLGQTVTTIGNALGEYNNSVSVGIVSGLDRNIEVYDDNGNLERLRGVIQTDASINSGNSGGPLFDLSGKVIGINVATAQGANNISFAIPINDALNIINRVVK